MRPLLAALALSAALAGGPAVAELKAGTVNIARKTETVDIEVYGGIGPDTVARAVEAGANVLIAGSALYRDPAGLEHAVTELRRLATAAAPAAP